MCGRCKLTTSKCLLYSNYEGELLHLLEMLCHGMFDSGLYATRNSKQYPSGLKAKQPRIIKKQIWMNESKRSGVSVLKRGSSFGRSIQWSWKTILANCGVCGVCDSHSPYLCHYTQIILHCWPILGDVEAQSHHSRYVRNHFPLQLANDHALIACYYFAQVNLIEAGKPDISMPFTASWQAMERLYIWIRHVRKLRILKTVCLQSSPTSY